MNNRLYYHRILGGRFWIKPDGSFWIVKEPVVPIWPHIRLLWVTKTHLSEEDLEYFILT